jgi:hypothetical protein
MIPRIVVLQLDMYIQQLIEMLREDLYDSHGVSTKVLVVTSNNSISSVPCYYCKRYDCTNCLELNGQQLELQYLLTQLVNPLFDRNRQLF